MQPQMKSQELQKVSQNVDTFAPVADQKAPQSRASQLLATLNDVIPGVAEGATNELGRVIQEDETRQASRALTGMQPTDDATVAGAQAHKNVNTRNAVSSRMRELATEATEFEGSSPDLTVEEREAEWEEHVLQVQSQLVNEHSREPEDTEMIGMLFRDMLPKVADTRYQTAQQQDQIAKYRSAVKSFESAVDPTQFTEEEMRENVNQILVGEGDGMGMTTEARRKAFVDSAVNAANRDDLTLMEVAKELGIYDQEPGLVNAERQAEGRLAQEQQADIAMDKTTLLQELSASPYMTQEEFFQRAGAQTTEEGQKTWGEREMREAWRMAQKAQDDAWDIGEALRLSLVPPTDENAVPASHRHYDDRQKRELVEAYDLHSEQILASHMEGLNAVEHSQEIAELTTRSTVDKSKWLASNNLVDEKWAKEFEMLNSIGADTWEQENLPEYVVTALDRYQMLKSSPGAIARHADTKTVGMMVNYDLNLANGSTPVAAMRDAHEMAKATPVKFPRKELERFENEVRKKTQELLQPQKWYLPNSFTGEDADETTVRNMTARVDQRARDLISVGHVSDYKTAVERAVGEIGDTFHQLQDGSQVEGNPDWIASEMQVPVHQIDTMLNSFRDALADNEDFLINTSSAPENWKPEISPGGNVIWRDEIGNPVTRPVTLGEVGGTSMEARRSELWEQQSTLHERRLEAQRVKATPRGSEIKGRSRGM